MNSPLFVAVAHHLWQSTLFAAAVGALTLLFRRNRASLRHALWLTASLKFLVPFSLLTALGARFPLSALWQYGPPGESDVAAPPGITPPWLTVLDDVAAPLAPSHTTAVNVVAQPVNTAGIDIGTIIGIVWLLGTLAVLVFWCVRWINVRRTLRNATPIDLAFCIPVKCGDSLLEPGIVGLFRPVLFLPRGIEQRLTPSQLQAVLAHEQCHVRRRDNLMAALHMIVEAAFWFHPLVWWIGARLVAERERACDEHVVRAGHASSAYAEGILNVCQHYLESKLPFVSGVSGADLRQRIERVVGNIPVITVSAAKKSLLAVASCMALVVPIAIGCFTSGAVRAQSGADPYESIMIRETPAATTRSFLMVYWPFSGSFEIENRTLRQVVAFAYGVDESRVSGPEWLGKRYDIRATNAPDFDKPIGSPTLEQIDAHRQKLQALLASRFGLVVKRSTSARAAFALKVADTGSRFPVQRWTDSYFDYFPKGIHSRAQSIPWLAEQLAERLGAPVLDETELLGLYTLNLAWGPESGPREPSPLPVPVTASLLESALHDQLGLTLERRSRTLESIVVESVHPPRSDVAPDAALASQSVTIRLASKDIKGNALGTEPSRNALVYRNVTLRDLIASAYHIANGRISGAAWLDDAHLDVYVKGVPGWGNGIAGGRDTSVILRDVLEQKFGLVVERKGLEVTAYTMKVAAGGLKATATSPNAHMELGSDSKNAVDATGYTLENFVAAFSGMAGGSTVNETGLAGTYDFHLSWGPKVSPTDPTPAVKLTPEKWRETLLEQAGLLLEPRKTQTGETEEGLTVVRVKQPSEVLPLTL